jgi:hypothetical protein
VTDKEKTTQDSTFDTSSCIDMMGKMMGQQMEGCNFSEIISHFSDEELTPDVQKTISQMKSCFGIGK